MPTATKCAVPWWPVGRRSRPWRRTSRPESASGSGSRRPGNPSALIRRDFVRATKAVFEALRLILSSKALREIRHPHPAISPHPGRFYRSTSPAYATSPLPGIGGRMRLQGSHRIFTSSYFFPNEYTASACPPSASASFGYRSWRRETQQAQADAET